MDFIRSQDRQWSNLFTAISLNFPVILVIDFNWLQRQILLFNNFLKKDFQKWIGFNDVKSTPVHFYVQRNSAFTGVTPIPFDLARVNEGNAMNLTSGKFTAPRTGIYFFSFTGNADFPASSSKVYLGVQLYLNGGRIGLGYVEESNTVANQNSPLTLQSTLNLNRHMRMNHWRLVCNT